MRTIRAVFDGKVFVPEEEVGLSAGSEGLVMVHEERKKPKAKWKPPNAAERKRIKRQLQDHFDQEFPRLNLKAEGWLVDLVGILPPMTDEEIKEMYYMHFLETDE